MRRRGTLTGQPGEGNVTLAGSTLAEPCQGQPYISAATLAGATLVGASPGGGNPGRGKTGQPGGVAIETIKSTGRLNLKIE